MGVATPYIAYIVYACMGSMLFLGNIDLSLSFYSNSLLPLFSLPYNFSLFPSPFFFFGGGGGWIRNGKLPRPLPTLDDIIYYS